MPTLQEPTATALLLATYGVLMAVSVVFSRTLQRLGVPIVLLFLIMGMLAGSDGLGLEFDDYSFAFRIGTMALVLILFDGGLNTPLRSIRKAIAPATVLATFGVAGAALLVALTARLLGLPWMQALLLGAVVSSTDSATVFSVLRGSGLNLQKRVGLTLELESGLNDPMAVILTATITECMIDGTPPGWGLLWEVPIQLVIGLAAGIVFGWLGTLLLRRIRVGAGGLYPVLTIGTALLAFGAATLVHGSGFLAVYAAAVLIGNHAIPYRHSLIRIHDAVAWLGQISMFLMLGLLVYPSHFMSVAWLGAAIAFSLAFIARPLVTMLCLLPFRFPMRDSIYIGWVGLRGAVPIILATFPVLAGVEGAQKIFNIVFFIVVINALVPGATLRWVTRWMKLEAAEPPTPPAALEINSMQMLRGEVMSFYIDSTLAVCGVSLSRIRFPSEAAAILVVRGNDLIAPRGTTILQAGDHVYILCRESDRPFIQLMFGRPEEG